ncbi:hypothetical protein PTKIN_Ptkin17bG0117600 [Pterospermum kingtungense]
MKKLFRSSNKILYSALKTPFQNHDFPNIIRPISHLHSSTKTLHSDSKFDFVFNELAELQSSKPISHGAQSPSGIGTPFDQERPTKRNESTVQISHPWQEWVDLMECLLKKGYFDGDGNPFENGELGSKEANTIRTACLNFARDRFSLLRYFSRKDIQVIAGCGCPSLDRKVVNSGKRLRAYVGIDEGSVCSSCTLRGNCDRVYVKARDDEGGRTVDVMRILLTYGLDSITGSVENKPCQNKLVKESVRRLLKEMVDYSNLDQHSDMLNASASRGDASLQDHSSTQEHIKVPMKQGNWLCPKCNFLNFARNIKCLRCDCLFEKRLRQLREDQDHLPLKKGDWICDRIQDVYNAKRSLQSGISTLGNGNVNREFSPTSSFPLFLRHFNMRAMSTQFQYDNEIRNGGFEGSTGKLVEQDRKQYKGAYMWRFVHEDNEDECYDSLTANSKFIDFPVARGKTTPSHYTEVKEEWKLEMSETTKCPTRIMKNDECKCTDHSQRKLELLECSDDEEIAGWFRRR